MRAVINGRLRTIRGGRLSAAGLFRRMPSAVNRRQQQISAMKIAIQNHSDLNARLDEIANGFRKNLNKGRFYYHASLEEIYALVTGWESDGILESRMRIVAALRGKTARKNANPFGGVISAVSDKDRRTVSRWSLHLKNAMSAGIRPKDLIDFLRGHI